MRARITLFQALLSFVASIFGFPARAATQCPTPSFHETKEDCPWAGVSRTLEGVSDSKLIKKAIEDSVPGFLHQLEQDKKTPGLIGLWGLSRNIDESNLASGRKTVPANLIQFLNSYWNAPYDSDFIFGHAGLNHTYGYLFSILETPYGYKRARYVRHEIEAGFGLKEGILSGTPKQGTLLLNLTLFAGKIAFRDDASGRDEIDRLFKSKAKTAPRDLIKFDFTKLQPKRLTEVITTEDQTIEMRTDLVPFLKANPHGKNRMLLIHSILIQKKDKPVGSPELITVFPVEASFAENLFKPETFGDSVPLKLRYNAALPFTLAPEKMIGKRYLTHETH